SPDTRLINLGEHRILRRTPRVAGDKLFECLESADKHSRLAKQPRCLPGTVFGEPRAHHRINRLTSFESTALSRQIHIQQRTDHLELLAQPGRLAQAPPVLV